MRSAFMGGNVFVPGSFPCRDHVRLDLSVHRAMAETGSDGARRGLRCFLQAVRAARLDLVAQRRALAIADRRVARRGAAAALRQGFDVAIGEAGGTEIAPAGW